MADGGRSAIIPPSIFLDSILSTFDWKAEFPDLMDEDYCWTLPQDATQLPSNLWLDWMLDSGSLTKRLQRLSQGTFNLGVLEECWQAARPKQVAALGVSSAEHLWSRRVVLRGGDVSWVVAHSYIAGELSVQAAAKATSIEAILALGDRPLGALLFEHPAMKRGPIEICKTRTGWGRRSRFTLDGTPLVVAEYFLAALVEGQTEGMDSDGNVA